MKNRLITSHQEFLLGVTTTRNIIGAMPNNSPSMNEHHHLINNKSSSMQINLITCVSADIRTIVDFPVNAKLKTYNTNVVYS